MDGQIIHWRPVHIEWIVVDVVIDYAQDFRVSIAAKNHQMAYISLSMDDHILEYVD